MTKEEKRFTNGLQPYAGCFSQLAFGGIYLQFKTNIK